MTILDLDQDEVFQMINHYGTYWAEHKCIEEPAELIQAITKLNIALNDDLELEDELKALKEEMADVFIVLKMLQELYNISNNEFQAYIKQKMKRNMERIR